MKKLLFWAFLAFYFVGSAFGQETNRYGISATAGAGIPVMGMRQWYHVTPQLGIQALFETSPNTQVVFEFHFMHFKHGAIEKRKFQWLVDDRYYSCPKASAHMVWNDVLLSLRTFLPNKSFSVAGRRLIPYFSYGAGLYNYTHHVSGLIYPGQPREPLNPNFLMEPVSDRRVAWGATAGTGFSAVWSKRMAGTIQINYHVVVGYMRPFEDWGFDEIFPLQFFDVRVGWSYFF